MKRIEDSALIGDWKTAALVRNDGAIEWLCFPWFDDVFHRCWRHNLGPGPAGSRLERRARAHERRARQDPGVDGQPPGEDDARPMFEELLAVRNDVGLLSESYDVAGRRLAGNFPQAFSHIGLVNSARLFEPTAAEGGPRGRGDQA